MALGFTQPLKEMSTRKLPGGKVWPACKADTPITICLENLGALTFHNPMGLHRMLQLYFLLFYIDNSIYEYVNHTLTNKASNLIHCISRYMVHLRQALNTLHAFI
jgi:hypothetical protein